MKRCNIYPQKTICTLAYLALTLTLSNFIFNFKFYLQIKYCVTETVFATANANIFMPEFEVTLINLLIKNKSILWL